MHFVTKVNGGRSDGRVASLSGPPIVPDSPKRTMRIIRDIVQGVWRRRFLIILPVILMLPVSIAAAFILPKAYTARSLMQLQEAGRENPFSREGGDASSVYRIQERFEGLKALFTSDRVLSKAFGVEFDRLSPAEREAKIGDLRQALSLELIGGDFIEVKLSGAKPEGLGRTLEAVMASFLEALVPEQGGATAAQLMVNARRQDWDALLKSREDVQRELATLLPNGSEEAVRRLAILEQSQREKRNRLSQTDAEIERLRGILGNPSDEQVEHEMTAPPSTGSGGQGQPAETDQAVSERMQNLSALKALLGLRKSLAAETRDLGSAAETLNGHITRFQELQDRLAGLEKDIATARQTYEEYQKRFSSTNAVRSIGILKAPELIRIVDPPRDPATTSRSRLLYFLSGITAGGLLGLGLAFVAERLDQRIRHADEASEAAGIPVLVMVHDQDHHSKKKHFKGGPAGSTKPPHLSSAAS